MAIYGGIGDGKSYSTSKKKSFSPGDVALDPAADGTIKDADK